MTKFILCFTLLLMQLNLKANEKLLKPAEVFSHPEHVMFRPIFDNDYNSSMYLDTNIWLNNLSLMMLQNKKKEAHELLKRDIDKAWIFRLDYALSALYTFKDKQLFEKEVDRLSKMKANASMNIDLARLYLLNQSSQNAIKHTELAANEAISLRDHLDVIHLLTLCGKSTQAKDFLKSALNSNFGGIPVDSQNNFMLKLWENYYLKKSAGLNELFIQAITDENVWEPEELFITFKRLLKKDFFDQALIMRVKVDSTFAYIVVDNVKLWNMEKSDLKKFISNAVKATQDSEDPLDSKSLYKLSIRDYSIEEDEIAPEERSHSYLEIALGESKKGNRNKSEAALGKLNLNELEAEDGYFMLAQTYLNLGEKEKALNVLGKVKAIDEYFPISLYSSHSEIIKNLLKFYPPNSKENLKNRIFLYQQLNDKDSVHKNIKKLFSFANGHEFSESMNLALRSAFSYAQIHEILDSLSEKNPLLTLDLFLKFDQRQKAVDLSNSLVKEIDSQEVLTQLYIKVYRLKLNEALPAILEKGISLARQEKSGVLFRLTHAAEIYNELGNSKKAQAYMIAAEAHQPLSNHDFLRIAYVYAKSLSNIVKAKKFIEKVNPNELMIPMSYTNYAECMAIIGEKEKALKYFDLAISKVRFPPEVDRIKAIKEKYFK